MLERGPFLHSPYDEAMPGHRSALAVTILLAPLSSIPAPATTTMNDPHDQEAIESPAPILPVPSPRQAMPVMPPLAR